MQDEAYKDQINFRKTKEAISQISQKDRVVDGAKGSIKKKKKKSKNLTYSKEKLRDHIFRSDGDKEVNYWEFD